MRLAARRTAFGLGAALLLAIGFGFLTVAAWLALEATRGALFAATVIGAAYVGLGLVVLALGTLRRPLPPPNPVGAPPPAAASLQGLAGAFLQGIGAGMAARANISRPAPPPPPPPPPPAE